MAEQQCSTRGGEGKGQFCNGLKDMFGDNPHRLRQVIEEFCQDTLEAEFDEHVGAEPYERSQGRRCYRNGYKPRSLRTRMGEIFLQVPQARDGSFQTQIFERYQRTEKALCLALMEGYVQGVSTRKVKRITEQLCGTSFSATTISELCKQLDEDLERFRQRDLAATAYPYLIMDARYEKVRCNGHVVSQAVLLVVGVNEQGYREVLAVELADLESEASWRDILHGLKQRGLHGVTFIVSDHHEGIRAAVAKEFTGCLWQRCRTHFIANLLRLVSPTQRAALLKALHYIWEAPTLAEAHKRLRLIVAFYATHNPQVAERLELGCEDTFSVFAVPEPHRKQLRTNNCVERLNQTIKQRTRIVRIFPNRESCLRLISAILVETHEDWISGNRYLSMQPTAQIEPSALPLDAELNVLIQDGIVRDLQALIVSL